MKSRFAVTAVAAALLALMALVACGDKATSPPPAGAVYQVVTFSSVDGLTLSGRLFGEGDSAVVLAHMFPADQESWRSFAEELVKRGYLVLTFDFRGYGDSDGPKEIDRIDLDVEGALDFLEKQGVRDVFLVGASMGGTASLKVAARRSVSGVISLSGPVSFRGLDVALEMVFIEEPKLLLASATDILDRESLLTIWGLAPRPKETLVLLSNAHGTDMLKGAEAQRAKDAILAFLEKY